MTDKWEANVGQLRLVGGNRVDEPANLSVLERRSFLPVGGRGKGRLYTMIELTGGAFGREELCQDLVSAIEEEYFHTPGTVTYGLRQAILLANATLWRLNAQQASERRMGGVACVVLRGAEAFIAQAGWPVVYLVHDERLQAFPDTTLEDEDTSVLGQRQSADVRLFHALVQPGDTILIMDGPMARHLSITRIAQTVTTSIEQTISNLETLAPAEDCSAMVIQVGMSASGAPREQWAFTPVETPPVAPAASALEPQSESAVRPEEQVDEPWPDEPASDRIARRQRSRRVSPALTDRIGAVLGTLGRFVRTVGERLLPDRQAQPSPAQHRQHGTHARRERAQEAPQTRRGIIAAIAVPLVVLLVVGGYLLYRDWSLRSEFDKRLSDAKLSRDIALASATSPSVARDYWQQVITNLEVAAKLLPERTDLQPMREEAEQAIDRINGVTRITPVKLYDYQDPGSVPSRVIVAGLNVYVLDRGLNRVYHHILNERRTEVRDPGVSQILIQQGQPVEGQSVGSLIDIAWFQNGGDRQAGALLILDRNGLLLEYDPAWEKLRAQTIGGQSTWRTPVAMRTFDSNLYLLDPTANQVLKYWKDQFAKNPDSWVKKSDADLSKAMDLAIDGNIFVLHSDGKIDKYFGGESVTFTQTKSPRPLTSAAALHFDIEEVVRNMYIVDPTDMRIVQLDHTGTFVRQFQPVRGQEVHMRQPAGVFVDETGGKLYYVAANALYVADIAPVQP